MEKKMVLLAGCLVVALLLCGAPQVVFAFEHPEDHDQKFVMDSDAGEPEFDEEGDEEEEGSDENY